MKKAKITKSDLKRKLFEAEAQQIHTNYYASKEIDKCSVDRLAGSAVILELTFLGGKKVFSPTSISGGLSKETIEAIKKDLKRSYDYNTEFKL